MKRVLAFVMVTVMLVFTFSPVLQANSARNNHTWTVITNFSISDTGLAEAYIHYFAYEDVMTEAEVTFTLKKRTLLLFWTEVTTSKVISTAPELEHFFRYQLTEKGTYKCEVEYIVYGTAGEPDVLPFEDTATY